MITLKNNDTQPVDWYIMPKYDCDINNAVGSGSLVGSGSAQFNTNNSQTVVFAFGTDFAAGAVCSSNATVTFNNDPNGAWCQVA